MVNEELHNFEKYPPIWQQRCERPNKYKGNFKCLNIRGTKGIENVMSKFFDCSRHSLILQFNYYIRNKYYF
jgi:hypothetical protein